MAVVLYKVPSNVLNQCQNWLRKRPVACSLLSDRNAAARRYNAVTITHQNHFHVHNIRFAFAQLLRITGSEHWNLA